MKRLCWIVSILMLSSGCLLRPKVADDVTPPLREGHALHEHGPLPAAPVMPEDVTAANAHDMANALWDEYDCDEPKPVCPPGCPHCKRK
jgi:hypothetical protein